MKAQGAQSRVQRMVGSLVERRAGVRRQVFIDGLYKSFSIGVGYEICKYFGETYTTNVIEADNVNSAKVHAMISAHKGNIL